MIPGRCKVLNDDQRQGIADALHRAFTDRGAVPPPSRLHPALSLEDGYAVQALTARLRLDQGARQIGYKVGLTSRAMQTALQCVEPQYGYLLDDRLFQDGARIPAYTFLRPKLEVELAFVLGSDLRGPGTLVHDVLRATEYVLPALEIVDYRTEVPRLAADMVADNTAGAGAILGGRPVRPMDLDLRWVGATLAKNGIIEESGVSAAVMGHPAAGVAVLANKLAAAGASLKAGQIVLAGSFTHQVAVARGDVIHADFGPLGAIGASFG